MKLYHFVIIFVIILIGIVLFTDINVRSFKEVVANKEKIDRNIDAAIDDGITRLAVVDEGKKIVINKDAAINSFFLSLYSSFGIISSKESQEKLSLYIPVVAVTMEDGFYVFYSDEYTETDGFKNTMKRWSEKFPYYYEDQDFIYGFTLGNVVTLYDKNMLLGSDVSHTVYHLDYHDLQTKSEYASFRSSRPDSILLNDESYELVRKGTIIRCIEDTLAYYTSRHNHIAARYGITYNFSLPAVDDYEWAPYLNNIGMFVVFQGYPYGSGAGEVYNRFTSAGAKISKNEVYYMEQKGWYLIYHRDTCPELKRNGIIFRDEPMYSIKECVSEGCYACPVCMQNGILAPKYMS